MGPLLHSARNLSTGRGFRVLLLLAFTMAAAILIAISGSAKERTAVADTGPRPVITPALRHDSSPPLTSMKLISPKSIPSAVFAPKIPQGRGDQTKGQGLGAALGSSAKMTGRPGDPSLQVLPPSPGPLSSFDGVTNVSGLLPPDANGDVGPDHYVSMVNSAFAIYDKNGTLAYGPANNSTLWAGFGGVCESRNDGDPIVLYDPLADRWLMSQFAVPGGTEGYHQCIAVSKGPDPTGGWYRYDYRMSKTKMNDYPKFGVWPTGYFMSVNQFDTGGFAGVAVAAFERDKMLQGLAANLVSFDLQSGDPLLFGLLPADLDGSTPPPANSPNYFVSLDDNEDDLPDYATDRVQIFKFKPNWSNPVESTFTGPTVLDTTKGLLPFSYNYCDGARNCIGQPNTAEKLDAISGRAMYRLAYRNRAGVESLLLNATVTSDAVGRFGVRWIEMRSPSGTPSIFQQGTWSGSGVDRWMASMAMDKHGNIALGYSAASETQTPDIRYAVRAASDPAGTLRNEAVMMAGNGSQTHSASRWGDYTMMSVDPIDDCTFWYTNEYMPSTSSAGWRTRVGSFRMPTCTTAATTGAISGRVTDGAAGPGVGGVVVRASNGTTARTDYTDENGDYQISMLPGGSYTLTTNKKDFAVASKTAATSAGANTTSNITLTSTAPVSLLNEAFSSGSLPVGWSVVDNAATGAVWRFNNPGGQSNLTGGAGGFAIIDSDYEGELANDTELRSPSVDFSGKPAAYLRFKTDFYFCGAAFCLSNEIADADISVDGGTVWTNVWRKTANYRGPATEVVNISSIAANQADVRVRFHYHNAYYEWWWEVDDVSLGDADVTPPTNPTITGPEVNSWSFDSKVKAVISGGSDAKSGVSGYSYIWTRDANIVPDKELDIRAWQPWIVSPPLSNGAWYLVLRSVDHAGNWSNSVVKAKFNIDTSPSIPAMTTFSSPWAGSPSFPVKWTKPVDVASVDIRYRRAPFSGTFGAPVTWKAGTTSTIATFPGAVGNTYCYSARSRDAAGLASSWGAERCIAAPLSRSAFVKGGAWASLSGSAYYAGSAYKSASYGATLSRGSIKAKKIGFVATKCPTCGKVNVYWNGAWVATVNLAASTTVTKQLITVKTFAGVASGTLKLKVVTSGKPVIIHGASVSAM